jgi:hypothetical protein
MGAARDALAREHSGRRYAQAELPLLAQGIYVRALLAVRNASGGRVANVKPAAYDLTADAMTKVLGQQVTAGHVRMWIEGPTKPAEPPPGTGTRRAKG